MYIASQIMSLIGLIIDIVAKTSKSKQQVLILTALALVFYALCYVFLNTPLLAVFNTLAIVECLVYTLLDHKNRLWYDYLLFAVIMVTAMIIALIILKQNNLDIIILISGIFVLLVYVFKNMLIIRLGLLIDYSVWLIYNLTLNAYVNLISITLSMLAVTIALVRYNLLKRA